MPRSISTSRSSFRRSSGSPPVSRILRTPSPTNTRATRVISSKVSSVVVRQERIVAAEHVLRHAVDAAEVAAVGDRDAQVVQRPAARVGDRPARPAPARHRARTRASAPARLCARTSASGMIVAMSRLLNAIGNGSRRGSRRVSRWCMIGAPSTPRRRIERITMLPVYFSVDVVMERIPLVNRWVSEQWQPAAVVPVGAGSRRGRRRRERIADGARGHDVALSAACRSSCTRPRRRATSST